MGKTPTGKNVCPPDAPRLLAIIDFFEQIPGGEVQIHQGEISTATGIPIASLKRHLDWARRYGIIEVTREFVIGEGRKPNRYELVIGREEWEEVGLERVRRYAESAARDRITTRGAGKGQAESLAPSQPLPSSWDAVR